MFEDFKDKVKENNSPDLVDPSALPPEVDAKLRAEGLDPETVTLEELYPEGLDCEGNDLSLMSGFELEIWLTYWRTRRYLVERYPRNRKIQALLISSCRRRNQ